VISLTLTEQVQSYSHTILESVQSEGSSGLLCPACISGERTKSREGGKMHEPRSHRFSGNSQSQNPVFFCRGRSVNVLPCHHQDHHLQFICLASLMYMMKYGPTLISTNEAGIREGYKLPRAVFATEKMVNKSFLYQGSPFTT